MSIKQRIQKLEQNNNGEMIIYITDPHTVDDEPIIRQACVDGRWIDRKSGETQDSFLERTNPTERHSVCIESSVESL
ncbi:hypothetical protein ROA7450_03377 [Roseovarius albus]|uniref:Uncharacterized protein n=1 Tax=Roseovarius albus TaxID=1247867 RepID=A0A1X6ZWT3_9RHOB|nr:hypothetical protein [Roseovarius albus]SLN64077.1 hypothetical protein ROA7450_03377 [Roseovarius albus]